jgi:hypothetical protein
MAPWTAHPARLHFLEDRMSDTSDAIAELNTETDNLAARIDGLLENVDDATASELRLVSARLKGLAADPANPVPPVDENGETV